jgi:hypothetical protein
MDFSRLQAVKTVNPTGQKFNIEWKPGKQSFRLSDAMFAKMDLEYNSLEQFDDIIVGEDGENELVGVFLAVCKGNDGKFHKKQKGKQKGKAFKNIRLSETVEKLGITPELIDIEYKGANGTMEMYQLVKSTKTPVEESPVGDMIKAEVVSEPESDSPDRKEEAGALEPEMVTTVPVEVNESVTVDKF